MSQRKCPYMPCSYTQGGYDTIKDHRVSSLECPMQTRLTVHARQTYFSQIVILHYPLNIVWLNLESHEYGILLHNVNPSTVFILIEARHASAGISPSETVLISGENNYCDRNTTYPLQVFIVIWLIEASPYNMQHI